MSCSEDAPEERHWLSRWARALLAVVLSAGAVTVGFWLRPSKPLAHDIVQPTITILASQARVSAVVTMSSNPVPALSASPSASAAASGSTGSGAASSSPRPGYQFQLTLKVLSPLTGQVTFLLLLSDFPRLLVSNNVTPLESAGTTLSPGSLLQQVTSPAQDAVGRADFVAVETFHPAATAALRQRPSEPAVKITTQYSLVSRSSGAELQVAFPLIENEQPAPALRPNQSIAVSGLFTAYRPTSAVAAVSASSAAAAPRGYYLPLLEPGNTQYRASSGVNLADYQTLAGTPPLIRPQGAWSWTGTSDVSMLAQDALAADVAQEHVFWAGVAWGVAAAGVIAAVLEIVSAIQEGQAARRKRKRAGLADALGAAADSPPLRPAEPEPETT